MDLTQSGENKLYPQFDVQLTDNFGYVGTLEATKALKEFFEVQKALRFHALRTSANFGKTDILKGQNKRYHWAEIDSYVSGEAIPFDGIPYIILDKNVYECEYGADHKIRRKERGMLAQEVDSDTKSQKKRARNSDKCRKRNCPAKIRMKEVIKFPDFKLIGDTRYKRKKVADMLNDAIAKGAVRGERRIYIYFPSDSEHRGHTVRSQVCATRQQVDGRIINLIDQLVGESVTNVEEITHQINRLIEDTQGENTTTSVTSTKECYPSDGDLSYHIEAAKIIHTYSNLLCDELEEHVSRSLSKHEDQKVFFRKSSAEDKLLLVHQTLEQQRILEGFVLDGKCTLDSTCQTTKDSLPLLLVAVQGGSEHQEIIGSAILQEKSYDQVREALEVLQSWNPAWRPKSFMVEYDEEELAALEDTFEEVPLHVCDYHRHAAWTKWAQNSNDSVQGWHTLVAVLESIANARTKEAYCRLLEQFQSSDLWRSNQRLQTWFSSNWLSKYPMWAQAFLSAKRDPNTETHPLPTSEVVDDGSAEEIILRDSLRKLCKESVERLGKLATDVNDSTSLTSLLRCLERAEKRCLRRTSNDCDGNFDKEEDKTEISSGERSPKRQKLKTKKKTKKQQSSRRMSQGQ